MLFYNRITFLYYHTFQQKDMRDFSESQLRPIRDSIRPSVKAFRAAKGLPPLRKAALKRSGKAIIMEETGRRGKPVQEREPAKGAARGNNRKGRKEMYDLIIIGSGPAGLSAAVYGRRAGFSTLVIEKNPMSGGQVLNTYEVDNYLGLPGINGFDMGMKFREHAEKMQAEFVEADVTGIRDEGEYKTVLTDGTDYEGRAVIIASGAVHSHLGVPGEEELSGMGVSYCATCDGAFFRGKTVAVVGGGDVAVEDAIFLARGCEKVYLIHRRDSLRAARSLQQAMLALPNVEVIWDSVVERVCGEDMVQSLSLRSKKTGEVSELPVQGVFIAVGIRPNSEAFIGNIAADEKGYLIAGEDCATSMPGVYAAGDIRTKRLRQIVTAVADGANAVESAQAFLQNRN